MEKCVTCHFYDRRHARAVDGRAARSGQCRRTAPLLSPVSTKSYQIEGVWPTVRDDDWCGEWKILPRRPAAAPQGHEGMAMIAPLVAVGPVGPTKPDAGTAPPAALPHGAYSMAAD
jgi:hypothetical protein